MCQLMVRTPQGNIQDCYSNAPSKSIISTIDLDNVNMYAQIAT